MNIGLFLRSTRLRTVCKAPLSCLRCRVLVLSPPDGLLSGLIDFFFFSYSEGFFRAGGLFSSFLLEKAFCPRALPSPPPFFIFPFPLFFHSVAKGRLSLFSFFPPLLPSRSAVLMKGPFWGPNWTFSFPRGTPPFFSFPYRYRVCPSKLLFPPFFSFFVTWKSGGSVLFFSV